MTRLFVYGTLKRGGRSHRLLARQHFISEARTVPGYQLYRLDGYPGLVAETSASGGVTGELWAVDDEGLAELDRFEGLAEGLYRRESIRLVPPFDQEGVQAYVYARDVAGRPVVGPTWTE